MQKNFLEMSTDQKYELKRSRHGQKKGYSDPTHKRRVNITINGDLWDKLDEMGVQNKSSIIQEFVEQFIKEHEADQESEG